MQFCSDLHVFDLVMLYIVRFEELNMQKTHFVYLHGFASSPKSEKAIFFADKLRGAGMDVTIPDLNEPTFLNLTFTRQLAHVESIAAEHANEQLVLIGSSMGGLIATLAAQRLPNVVGLVLLAPGFGITTRWNQMPGRHELDEWKRSGWHDVFHYRWNSKVPLKYDFVEDANQYPTVNLKVEVPTLVFHGVHDEVIPVAESRAFADHNAEFVEYCELDSDHDLLNVLNTMWDATEQFLQRNGLSKALAAHR
jgi:pimeloyl-ACP methyl ester carboxylesterase